MISFNLKRVHANRSCIHGILSVPRFNFKCYTLELREGEDLLYKQNCSINLGNYILEPGFAQGSPMHPVFKRKPKGFAKRPELRLDKADYMHLSTGDIALGISKEDEFSLKQSFQFSDKFREMCKDIFTRKEIVVLTVYKSRLFDYEDIGYEDTIRIYDDMNFIGDDDDEQTELEHHEL